MWPLQSWLLFDQRASGISYPSYLIGFFEIQYISV